MWEAAGGRVSAAVGTSSSVAILGDDPAATGAVALGVARAYARTRRVFLVDLLGDDHGVAPRDGADEPFGVSDMVNYGVSLGRASRARAESPNLFMITGGAESPLNVDILDNRWWGMLALQVRRANALLLVAAPAMVPGVGQMVSYLDGVLLVGDAVAPNVLSAVLAEVRTAAAMRTPITSTRSITPQTRTGTGAQWRTMTAVTAMLLATAALTWPSWRALVGLGSADSDRGFDGALPPIPPPVPGVASVRGNEASYSVELLFTNSNQDAVTYLAQSDDSLPAATFSTVSLGADSDRWFRLVAGAFPDSVSAENFLALLRQRGRLTTGAGAIARTPFALLLDSASSDAIARVRVSAYRGRGIPAYLLRDSTNVWRVYAGAFPAESDAQLLKQQLDSLNIHSALVIRAGSTP